MKSWLAGWLIFGMTAVAVGADKDAVVIIGDCSGVCVDASGLVMTAKHCDLKETETVTFANRKVKAKRVYVSPDGDGPVVFDCDGDGFPWLPVAQAVPRQGSPVSSLGWPAINGTRQFRQAQGRLLRGGRFFIQGQTFLGNLVNFPTQGGWSGGPLLNAQGEVIGLLSASDLVSSLYISFAATRQAYETVTRKRDKLLVFTSPGCLACTRFKKDYQADPAFRSQLELRFEIAFVDITQQTELARKFSISLVPSFVIPGLKPLLGYEGKDRLLGLLSRDSEQPKAVQEETVDWSHVTVIVLAARQDVGQLRGTLREHTLNLAVGPLQRRVADATEGKATLKVIPQRTQPVRYDAMVRAADVSVIRFYVLVLVARQDLGLKGLIAKRIERSVADQLGDVPVDVIFEQAHADDYDRVVQALRVQEPITNPGEQPNDSPFPFQETALGGIVAILTERFRILRLLLGWFWRRKQA